MSLVKKSSTSNIGVFLSLISGAIIIVSGFVLSSLHIAVFPHFDLMIGPSGFSGLSETIASYAIIITGAIIVALAVVMNKNPHQSNIWGLVILFFSALSILEMGGFIVGGIIGIVGGSFAMSRKK